VVEPLPAVPSRRLGSLLGADWYLSRYASVAPLWLLALGGAVARRTTRGSGLAKTVRLGGGYALLTVASMVWHQLGQLAGGRVVGAPLSGVVVTATLAYQLYPEEGDQPSRVHLARALGGPLAHLVLGLAALRAWSIRRRNRILGYLASLNLAFAAASTAPIPTMDGGVVLRELRRGRAQG
jgi:Zn-dependent protease